MSQKKRKDHNLSKIGFPVNVKQYKEWWAKEVPESVFPAHGIVLDVDDVSETAAIATGISLDEAEIYDELLTPNALLGEVLPPANNDFYDEKRDKLIPKHLHAYKFYREIQANKIHPLKKQMTLNYYKPFEKENISLDYEAQLQVNQKELVSTPEVVLQIAIYKENRLLKTKGLLFLGSQTLAEFVDAIDCTMDLSLCWEDNSENPMLDCVDWATKTRASSALYLGDTIYIDKRTPGYVDYTEEIRKFLDLHIGSLNRGQEPISKQGDITETRFQDIELHLGLPYVFIHQGGCEHLIVVEQIRLFHPGDEPRKSNYPRQTFRGGPRRLSCTICNDRLARWITYNDEEAPSSPCFFCFQCFHMLHYNDDGQKLHDFNAFVYLENMDDRVGFQVAFQKFKDEISSENVKPDVTKKRIKKERNG